MKFSRLCIALLVLLSVPGCASAVLEGLKGTAGGLEESPQHGNQASRPVGETVGPQPDNNIVLPDDYRFSYRVTMRITTNQGTVEPVSYIQPDAPYYARKQATNGVTEFLVFDNQNNLAVLFGEKDGQRRRIHNRINLETKATLVGAFRDAPKTEPIKSIGSKTILGYPSRGYEISTLAGTTQLWVTDQAPASLFSTMFQARAEATGDLPLSERSMLMEVTFTSAEMPEKNYHMECIQLEPDTLILSKRDYNEAP